MMLRAPSRSAVVLAAGLVMMVATTIFAQQLSKPASSEQTTTRLVTEMISKYHIGQKQVDDKVSGMLLDRFVKELDPMKLYFYKTDIDELNKYRDHLDDLLKVGNVDFARQTFALYLKRLDERVAVAQQFVDMDHDFAIEEEMPTDGELVGWATTANEMNERWRKRIKYDVLVLKTADKSDKDADKTDAAPAPVKSEAERLADARKQLHKRYDNLKKTAHATEENEILEMYLSSMAHCFDPHSSYMSAQTLEDFQIQMRLSLEGIGAALKSEDGFTTVASIVSGGAAEKDGRLKVGDKIVAVAQEDSDYVDIVEMKLTRVVRLIRGPGGTKVRLKVQTKANETVEYVLTRQKIELTSQEVKGEIIPFESRVPGAKGRIGIINIPSFYRDFGGAQAGLDDFKSTARDVMAVLQDFQSKGGVDGIVIDLRMNGGGALSEAVEVSGLFIDQGPVVQVKEQNGRVKTHDDEERGIVYGGPLVVVCNRLSASASEIFAGVIKDYKRGIIVGDTTTHGKGTVQNVMPVSNRMFQMLNNQNLGALKLTINQFYRVNGDSTQNRGVESDVVLPSILDHMDLGESSLDNALAFDQVAPARHTSYDQVSPAIVAALRQASAQRVSADPKFSQIQKDIDRYSARKNRKSVSLNEAQMKKERDEDKAAEAVRKEEEEHETKGKDGPIFPKTEYNDEVLKVAADYLSLLRQAKTAAR